MIKTRSLPRFMHPSMHVRCVGSFIRSSHPPTRHCPSYPRHDHTQVRVGNLQELVYKQGQAGVTKATVTITFNNADKKSSPVGYEHFDHISVTRQVSGRVGR